MSGDIEKTTESFYLHERHVRMISKHAAEKWLDNNRSMALRQMLDELARLREARESDE